MERKVFFWSMILLLFAGGAAIAGECDALNGTWRIVPQSETDRDMLEAVDGVFEMTFAMAKSEMTVVLGKDIHTDKFIVRECTKERVSFTLEKNEKESFTISFEKPDTISVRYEVKGSQERQDYTFARKAK